VGVFDSILKINVEEMKAKKDVEGLIQALKNKRNVYIRRDAASALGDTGDARAIDPLVESLGDPNKDVRNAAVEAIGKLGGDPRAVELLLDFLKDKRSIIREEAASALGKVGHKNAVDPLIQALKDESWLVRQNAATSLGMIPDARAVEPLIQVLKDEDKDIRQIAVSALGNIGDARATEALIQTLKDEDKDIRQTAASALGNTGDAKAVEALIQTLKDESARVRYQAVESLEKIGDSRAVEPLIQALKDKGWIETAVETPPKGKLLDSFIEIGKKEKPSSPNSNKAWVRQKAIEALAKLGDARAVAPITEALNDKHEAIRTSAKEALERINAKTQSA